jgi:hypothetical protein
MKIIFLILFMLISCKTSPPAQKKADEFDKILHLKKLNDPKELSAIL